MIRKNPYQTFDGHLRYVAKVVAADGPNLDEFEEHRVWYNQLNSQIIRGDVSTKQCGQLRQEFGPAYSEATLQGYVYHWPLGYAGDYRLMEKIYENAISDDSRFRKYDLFFQQLPAAVAVRNRIAYFKALVKSICQRLGTHVEILNLASGSCREIKELLDELPSLPVSFDCVEVDERAIQYAVRLLGSHADRVSFSSANVFRFRPRSSYSLIWSAGLFDYFDDKVFSRIMKRFLQALSPGGELVVGNFGQQNPARGSMEALANWYLHHRSDSELISLATNAGVTSRHHVSIGFEPTGVNRFLHVANSRKAIRVDSQHVVASPKETLKQNTKLRLKSDRNTSDPK